jgi:2-keto-3-deoxy-L-rhamnonate aldolase RhmA
MKWIRERALSGEWIGGTWLNLGSSLTAEIAGKAGFDWLLIDLEHGMGDRHELLTQLQAIDATPAAPVVRIAWNDAVLFKRVLDLGVSGVMAPMVNTAEEARRAAAAMRFPPDGVRGVARMNRGCDFGPSFTDYFKNANSKLLTIIQIETTTAISNLDEIAAVDGVDVLFVGPLDLSVSLGVPDQFDHPLEQGALAKVVAAARKAGKTPGILVANEDQLKTVKKLGFTFVAIGSDGGSVVNEMRALVATLAKLR